MADVIIVGAGPAGCEAAWACAREGIEALLLTQSLDTVYRNRYGATREEDYSVPGEGVPPLFEAAVALGSDRIHRRAKALLEREDSLHLQQCSVSGLLMGPGGRLEGVSTWEGPVHEAPIIALCTGSFLLARLEAGSLREKAGHPGEMAYDDLGEHLQKLGFKLLRERTAFDGGTIEASVFAGDEFVSAGSPWFSGHPGLAAAGFCRDGYTGFIEAARSGAALGAELIRAVRSGDLPGNSAA